MSQPSSSQPTSRATKRQLSLSSQPQPGSSKGPRTHILLSTSLEVSETLATLAKEAADDIGVAGLGVGLAVLAEVLKRTRIKKMNIDGINTLLGRIQELFTILDDDKASRGNSGRLSDNVQRRIESLSDKWQAVIEDLAKTKERNMVIRFFTAKIDAEKITDLVKTMNESIQDFQLSVILDMDATVKETNATVETTRVNVVETHAAVEGTRITVNDVHAIVEKTHAKADDTHEDVQKLWDDLKGTREIIQQVATKQDDFVLPKGARNAQYDSNSTRRPCLPKTRTSVLTRLRHWIIIACTQPQLSAQIFWIHGLAGTGKTTIAYSIAQECDQKGLLAGNYFCSRFDAECSDPNFIFTTLSRQMCRVHAKFKQLVAEVLRKNPDIVDAGPARQLEELIVKPLEACHSAEDPFPTSVIVIDALDECRNGDPIPHEDGSAWSGAQSSTSIILATLAKFIPRLRPLLFIITSRPESHITPLFERPSRADDESLHPVTSPFGLHEVHLKSVLDDIIFYLDSEFRAALRIYHSREGWPAAQDITTLAEQSGGLWIYAATATRFIFNDGVEDPERQLESLIREDAPSVEPTTILFFLYNQVVKASYKKISDQLAMRLRSILGAIALSQEALSVPSLASLLNIEDHVVRNALKGLHSVLHIPPPGSTEAVRVIHPTFPEFLLYDSPDKHAAFRIAPAEEHQRLFSRCLEIIGAPDGLCYDIVGLGDPCCFKTEVGDLGERIKQSIPVHLKYAVRFWSAHLTGGHLSSDGSHLYLFHSFLYCHLLHWLEASSILNGLDTTLASLEAARRVCQASSSASADLQWFLWFLHDARRFVLTYGPCINAAPLQVYHSALELAPSSSLVSQAYPRMWRKESLVVCRGALQEWRPCLDSLIGHSGEAIYAVSFSPDNVFLVSGGEDGMVKVWEASTRTLVLDIQASSGEIRAVAYSPDGLHIAAGGDDGLSIWQAASGAKIHTVTDDAVVHVAYTADGSRLLSVGDSKVQLWQVSDGECLLSLDGDVGQHVGMSPDGAVIAFTRGASLFLHNVSSGKCEDLELPNKGKAAAFSSDGRYVAAATDDKIRIWSHQDRSLVRSVNVLWGFHGGLSFSPDSSRVCCASISGVIYVRLVESGDLVREFEGHTRWVYDVAWSSDGSQIVSVSDDGTIRLWDVTEHFPARQSPALLDGPRPGSPPVLVAEYKGRRMMLDHPPRPVADLFLPSHNNITVNEAPTFTSHPNRAVAWDHVADSTSTWRLERFYSWAALTGQNNFLNEARIAISSDGSLVAYAVARNICIRSLTTGDVVATLTPEFESGAIDSIAFSPDDSRLASGSGYPTIVAVWDVAAGVCVASHHAHSGQVYCVIFSSDGRSVVSGSQDQTARVFDISTKEVTRVLKPHTYSVERLMLSTDDRLLITQDGIGALYLWNIETSSCIAYFPSSDEFWITTLSFSPTGFSVSTKDGEHTVELWKAGNRAWPVYYISEEGWVYAKGPGYTRRLAWLPLEWRLPVWSDGAIFCVGEESPSRSASYIKNLIELDMSSLLDHAGISYDK